MSPKSPAELAAQQYALQVSKVLLGLIRREPFAQVAVDSGLSVEAVKEFARLLNAPVIEDLGGIE